MIPVEQFGAVDRSYGDQVTAQVERITGELNKLEQLLMAGMVDRRVLISFREAVNRIRTTSWNVQQWLEGNTDSARDVPEMLVKERVRISEQLANQLAADLSTGDASLADPELSSLQTAIDALSLVLLRRNRQA